MRAGGAGWVRGLPAGLGDRFLLLPGGVGGLVDHEDHERRNHKQAGDHRYNPQQSHDRVSHIARLGCAVDTMDEYTSDLAHAKKTLVQELHEHALIVGRVTLTSGAVAEYYVDAKRAILLPAGFAALSALVAAQVAEWGGT